MKASIAKQELVEGSPVHSNKTRPQAMRVDFSP
jgi:hypothetical protein